MPSPLRSACLIPVRQAEQVPGNVRQVRRQDHAAGMAGPAVPGRARRRFRADTGSVPKMFDEIEVGDQRAGNEYSGFHAFLGVEPGNGGNHQHAAAARTKHRRRRFAGREGQLHRFGRRVERHGQQLGEEVVSCTPACRRRSAAHPSAMWKTPAVRRSLPGCVHPVAQTIAREQRRLEGRSWPAAIRRAPGRPDREPARASGQPRRGADVGQVFSRKPESAYPPDTGDRTGAGELSGAPESAPSGASPGRSSAPPASGRPSSARRS